MEEKAKELIHKELIHLFGKEKAILVADMIFRQHYGYTNSATVWKDDFKQDYTNADVCKFWRELTDYIKKAEVC
jgi:hypothetical protein